MVRTNYLICYDITEDDIRFAVADICKDYGLERIQYSVFFGKLSRSHLKEIRLDINDTITNTNSDVHIIQVCASCESNHEILLSVNISDDKSDPKKDKDSDKDDNQDQQKSDDETIHTDYQDISEEIPYDEGVIII